MNQVLVSELFLSTRKTICKKNVKCTGKDSMSIKINYRKPRLFEMSVLLIQDNYTTKNKGNVYFCVLVTRCMYLL